MVWPAKFSGCLSLPCFCWPSFNCCSVPQLGIDCLLLCSFLFVRDNAELGVIALLKEELLKSVTSSSRTVLLAEVGLCTVIVELMGVALSFALLRSDIEFDLVTGFSMTSSGLSALFTNEPVLPCNFLCKVDCGVWRGLRLSTKKKHFNLIGKQRK